MRSPRDIELAPLLSAVGGLILIVSLFLDWYQPGLSAWTVFEVLDLVLAGIALAAVIGVLGDLLWDAPLRDGSLPVLGGLAFLIVVSQLINHPPAAQGASPQEGAWLALGGSVLMAVGGILSMAGMSLRLHLSAREAPRRARPGAPEPAVEQPAGPVRSGPSPATEAAALEPEVQEELYPDQERRGPIGADDPEPWTASPDDETLSFDPESRERS
jgi:hypothetical protein